MMPRRAPRGGGFSAAALFGAGEPGGEYDLNFASNIFADIDGQDPAQYGDPIARVDATFGPIAPIKQESMSARPIYGREPVEGRRNLLVASEDFENWQAYNVSPDLQGDGSVIITESPASDPAGYTFGLGAFEPFAEGEGGRVRYVDIEDLGARYIFVGGASPDGSLAAGGLAGGAVFDLEDPGVVQAPSSGDAALEYRGDGVWRVHVFDDNSGTDGARRRFVVGFGAPDGSGLSSSGYASGAGGRQIRIVRAQAEIGVEPSAYQNARSHFDITEDGVRSRSYALFDRAQALHTSAPGIVGRDEATIVSALEINTSQNERQTISYFGRRGSPGTFGVENSFRYPEGYIRGGELVDDDFRSDNRFAFGRIFHGVLSGAFSIPDNASGGSKLFWNGALEAQSSADLGGGAFGSSSDTFSVGANISITGNPSTEFEGKVYAICVRGAMTSDADRRALEKAYAQRLGVGLE